MQATLFRGRMVFGLLLILLLAGLPTLARADDEPDPFREAMKRMERAMQRMDHGAFRKLFDRDDVFGPWSAFPANTSEGRLGVALATPGAALADQLDLPNGSGLLVVDVKTGSPAEKAGLKKHDILLEWNGKPVPSRPTRFAKELAAAAGSDPAEAVVLRKGKKETVKGLKLAPKSEARSFGGLPWDDLPALGGGSGPGVATTVTRTGDKFTATHKEGDLTLTVKGKVDAAEPTVESVTVKEGDATKTYDSLDAVPEAHRQRASRLARMAAGEIAR